MAKRSSSGAGGVEEHAIVRSDDASQTLAPVDGERGPNPLPLASELRFKPFELRRIEIRRIDGPRRPDLERKQRRLVPPPRARVEQRFAGASPDRERDSLRPLLLQRPLPLRETWQQLHPPGAARQESVL